MRQKTPTTTKGNLLVVPPFLPFIIAPFLSSSFVSIHLCHASSKSGLRHSFPHTFALLLHTLFYCRHLFLRQISIDSSRWLGAPPLNHGNAFLEKSWFYASPSSDASAA